LPYAWHAHPDVWVLIAALLGGYVWALRRLGPRHTAPGQPVATRLQKICWVSGVVTVWVGADWPVHDLSERFLYSVHMTQHLLFTLVAPPLLLVGTPPWLFRPLLGLPLALPIGRWLTAPLFVFLAYNFTFSIWHVPRYYDAALQSVPIHALEHVTFIVTATLTWWPIFSPLNELPRLPDPIQCLYLFFESLPPTILGALITLSDSILYPTYARAPRLWGLSPEIDQQAAGLIMWIPGSLVFLLVLTIVWFRWLGREDYEQSQDARPVLR